MSIESDLYSTLSNNAGVTALVSTRIYPGKAPDGVSKPYIAYGNINGERLSTITGVGDAKRKLIQMDCVGDTYASAKGVAEAVETALEGDGYLINDQDLYSDTTQLHTVFVDWSFMAV